jgi:RNA binding exosome subunit
LKGAIQSLDVSYLIHSTEDADVVSSAVTKLFGIEGSPEVEEMMGHFGNIISRVSYHLHGSDAVRSFEDFASKLPDPMRKELAQGIGQYLDEHSSLFVRLDKQKLVRGEVALGTHDSVRLKVKPRTFMIGGQADGFFVDLLEGRHRV